MAMIHSLHRCVGLILRMLHSLNLLLLFLMYHFYGDPQTLYTFPN